MKKRISHGKTSWLLATLAAAVVSITIISVVFSIQRGVPTSSATYNADAGLLSFNEDFTTTDFEDTVNSTAIWDTIDARLELPTVGTESYYYANRTTKGTDDLVTDDSIDTHGWTNDNDIRTVVFDKDQRPHIVFGAYNPNPFTDIYYTHWDGTKWAKANGEAGYDNVSQDQTTNAQSPNITLDSEGNPFIAWQQTNPTIPSDIYFSYWNGSAWTGLSGPGKDNISNNASFPAPYITNVNPQIQVGSGGTPHITWTELDAGGQMDILYKFWNGSTWKGNLGSGADIISPDGVLDDQSVSFDLTQQNYPAFSWLNDAPAVLYSEWNGSAYVKANGTTAGADDVTTSLSFNGVATPSLRMDQQDNPNLLFGLNSGGFGTFRTDVYYTRWDDSLGAWATVDRTTPTAGFDNITNYPPDYDASQPSLEIDPFNNPSVSFSETTTDRNIFYTRWNGSAWTKADRTTPGFDNISNEVNFFGRSTHVLDLYGNPGIAYAGQVGGGPWEIYFTQWFHPCEFPIVGQSIDVDTTDEPIYSATLDVDQDLLGGSADWSLSNNGGASFEPVTLGESHSFTGAGSGLRWRVDLAGISGDAGACPLINDLTIGYSTTPVVRITGDDPVDLAINVSKQSFADLGATTVILGRSDLLIDEFVSTPLVSQTNAALLLTDPAELDTRTSDEIARILPPSGRIYLLGGVAALQPAVHDALGALGYSDIERLEGPTRYETAIEIYKEIESQNPGGVTSAYLTEADYLVDSFAIGPAAGDKTDGSVEPILLTGRGKTELHDSTKDFLATVEPELNHLELIGGPEAIPSSVGQSFTKDFSGFTTSRIAGQNRYHTNQLINEQYFPTPSAAVIANGEGSSIPGSLAPNSINAQGVTGSGLFTALLGGSFASSLPAPLILSQAEFLPEPNESYLSSHSDTISSVYIVGSVLDIGAIVEDFIGSLLL